MMDPWLVLGMVLVLLTIGVVLMLPLTPGFDQKKKKSKQQEQASQKDWSAVAARLSGQLKDLRRQKGELLARIKVLENLLAQEKDKSARWEEKFRQMERWEKKEAEDLEKLNLERKRLSQDVARLEEDLAMAKGEVLRLQKENDALKKDHEAFLIRDEQQQKEILVLRSQVGRLDENLRRVQREYELLKKKQEGSSFVARSEYDRVLKDLERLKRSLSKDREPDEKANSSDTNAPA